MAETKYNPKIHKRRSIRLSSFDYSSADDYFVTICTKNKECIFGEVINNKIHLNPYGYIISKQIKKTNQLRKDVDIGSFIVMPNHIHLIIRIKQQRPAVGARCARPLNARGSMNTTNDHVTGVCNQPTIADLRGARSAPLRRSSLSGIVRGLKSACTSTIRIMERNQFLNIWQRNYYERVIRSDREWFDKIEYIKNNPRKWKKDPIKIA